MMSNNSNTTTAVKEEEEEASQNAAQQQQLLPLSEEEEEEKEEQLNQRFLYQHPKTNQPSTNSLTTIQLCRILCPPTTSTSTTTTPQDNNHNSNGSKNNNGAPQQWIQPDSTLLISFDFNTGVYSDKGWLIARSIPILKEACCHWYYEALDIDIDHDEQQQQQQTSQTIKGPVSCRELSQLYYNQNSKIVINDHTRVWTSEGGGGGGGGGSSWTSIASLKDLQIAMYAFKDVPTPFTFTNDGTVVQTNNDKASDTIINSNLKTESSTTTTTATSQEFDPSMMIYDDDDDNDDNGNNDTTKQKAIQKEQQDELEAFLSSTADIGPNDNEQQEEEEEEEYESDGGTTYVKDHRTDKWIHADLMSDKTTTTTSTTGKRGREDDDDNVDVDDNSEAVKSDDKTVPTSNISKTNNEKKDNDKGKQLQQKKKKKKKGAKFKAKNAKNWIYITNLPSDTTQEELVQYFSKVGIIDLDPETQHPKVKLYRYRKGDSIKEEGSNNGDQNEVKAQPGTLKGDASICYAHRESVDLAIQILDDSYFRPETSIKVQRAKFEQHGKQYNPDQAREVSNAKRKVVRLAKLQAIGWDEDGENGRITGGLKGLRIIVLKHVFTLEQLKQASMKAKLSGLDEDKGEDEVLHKVEKDILKECEQWGTVEKITVFSKNADGVVVVKFSQPTAASKAVQTFNGKEIDEKSNRRIEASFWDGVTDYTVREHESEEKETEKRLDEFGDWLDTQELPEEFRLNVEGAD